MSARLHETLDLRSDGLAAVTTAARDLGTLRDVHANVDAVRDAASAAAIARNETVQRLVARVEALEADLGETRRQLAERTAVCEGLHYELLELRSAKELAAIIAMTENDRIRSERRKA